MNSWSEEMNPPSEAMSFYIDWLNRVQGGLGSLQGSPKTLLVVPYGRSLILYSFFWTILVLHFLVIHAYTWVSVPSATPSDILWVAVTQISLFRGHVHINVARMLVVGIYAELTVSPWIAPPPYSHSWLIALVLSLGTLWEVAFGGVPLFSFVILVLLAIWTFFVCPRTFFPPRCKP